MKRLLVLSVLGVFLAFSFSTAMAAPGSAPCVQGMYVSGKVGMSILSDSDLTDSAGDTVKLSYDTGWGLDVALGYQLPMFRVEGEVAYRSNDMDEASYGPYTAKVEGDIKAWSFMVNGYYDFRNDTAFTPYVGVGLGMARIDATINSLSLHGYGVDVHWDDSANVFAYQLMAGCNFALTKQISLDVEYRYCGTQDPEFDDGDGGKVKADVKDHNLMVGVRMLF